MVFVMMKLMKPTTSRIEAGFVSSRHLVNLILMVKLINFIVTKATVKPLPLSLEPHS